jgi:hypothetical protein
LDQKFDLTPQTRINIYKWGAAKFNHVINLKLPCISEFMECYQQFLIAFPTEPNTKENRWLENPKILKFSMAVEGIKNPTPPGNLGLQKRHPS